MHEGAGTTIGHNYNQFQKQNCSFEKTKVPHIG